jgi:hypothetical protein
MNATKYMILNSLSDLYEINHTLGFNRFTYGLTHTTTSGILEVPRTVLDCASRAF